MNILVLLLQQVSTDSREHRAGQLGGFELLFMRLIEEGGLGIVIGVHIRQPRQQIIPVVETPIHFVFQRLTTAEHLNAVSGRIQDGPGRRRVGLIRYKSHDRGQFAADVCAQVLNADAQHLDRAGRVGGLTLCRRRVLQDLTKHGSAGGRQGVVSAQQPQLGLQL